MSINWNNDRGKFPQGVTTDDIYASASGLTIHDDLEVVDGLITGGAIVAGGNITGTSVFLTGGLQADISVLTDIVNEVTTDNGVEVDGVLLRDGAITMGSGSTQLTVFAEYSNPAQINDDNGADSGYIPAGGLVFQRINSFVRLRYHFIGNVSPEVSIFDFGSTIPAAWFPSTNTYTERQMSSPSANSAFAFFFASPSEFRIGKVSSSLASVNFTNGEVITNVVEYYLI